MNYRILTRGRCPRRLHRVLRHDGKTAATKLEATRNNAFLYPTLPLTLEPKQLNRDYRRYFFGSKMTVFFLSRKIVSIQENPFFRCRFLYFRFQNLSCILRLFKTDIITRRWNLTQSQWKTIDLTQRTYLPATENPRRLFLRLFRQSSLHQTQFFIMKIRCDLKIAN